MIFAVIDIEHRHYATVEHHDRTAGDRGVLHQIADQLAGYRRRIVDAGDGERDGLGRGGVMSVGHDNVVGDRQLLAGSQEIESAIGRTVAEIDGAEAEARAVVQGQRQRTRQRQHALLSGSQRIVTQIQPAKRRLGTDSRMRVAQVDIVECQRAGSDVGIG